MGCKGYAGFLAATLGLVLIAPVALAQKDVKYDARFRAKYPAVSSVGTIGILGFNGNDGGNFTAALTAQLQGAQIDGSPIFQIKTLDSLNFKTDTAISKAEVAAAIRLGQKLGVKLVFTGIVSSATLRQAEFYKEETECVESTGFLKPCKRSQTKRTPCQKVTGQYTVSPQAIRVDTGAVVYSEMVSSQGEYSICNGTLQGEPGNLFGLFGRKDKNALPAISTPEALLDRLRNEAAALIRQQVAPYTRTVSVTMKNKAAGLSKVDAKNFDGGVAFANAGRMDRACSIFETLHVDPNKANVALLYNLGVCQEVLLPDEPGAALEYYAKADQLLSRPDKLVSAAYVRTKAMVGESRAIRSGRQ